MRTDARSIDRKRRGAWYTPPDLVATVVDAVITAEVVERCGARPVTVVDPACGDGRFLAAAAQRIDRLGGRARLLGVDIDADAVTEARASIPAGEFVVADALRHDWAHRVADVVVGNPPFLSQLAAATTRGRSSERGGGPYADVAVEFLALAADLVRPDGGRVALVLPQSLLSSRDAAPVRHRIDERATLTWSWWSPRRVFDADVNVCALAFEFGRSTRPARGSWGHVITTALGIPTLPPLATQGTLGDRARLNANFRDEYYGMVPAVGDHPCGPPLVTSGLIDPGTSSWGTRPVRFARTAFSRPRIDLARLDARMSEWAARRLVPKVLVANQTRIVEAVCDPGGDWLPGVPVVAAYPTAIDEPAAAAAWEIAAVLTSPVASAWLWHHQAGTGLSATSVRVSPTVLAELPWPAGDPASAVAHLRRGDVRGCGAAVDRAYGLDGTADTSLHRWWSDELDRLDRRRGEA